MWGSFGLLLGYPNDIKYRRFMKDYALSSSPPLPPPLPPEGRILVADAAHGGSATSQAPPLPRWDDSDAEQQTLRELHMNLKKEKTRENQNEAVRRQINDEGDHSTTSARPTLQMEVWKQSREDGHRQQTTVEGSTSKSPGRKHGVSSPLPEWSKREISKDLVTGADSLYPSLVVKDADGKRYLYYFSEGSTAFYPADNEDSEALMPRIADKVETYVRRGWQEVFGVIRIMTSVIVILLVESLNFVTNQIAQPLILGVLSTVGDRLIKPLLAALFNLVLQPAVIFSWNLAAGLGRVCQPLIDILGGVTFRLAQLLQSFRLVEVTLGHEHPLNHRQQNMHVV